MKDIIITFPNGDKFSVPAKEIALHRTNYYAEFENLGYKTNEWHEEFEYSMKNENLIDWLKTNMTWEDIERYAIKLENPKPNYYKLFPEATFTI